MSVSIKYKGAEIASANTDTTKTIKTSGKYCEGDIEVINTQDGGITPTGNINITDTNVTDVTNYATAQVVDADLVAENIKEGVNILGILGTFAGGGGGDTPFNVTTIILAQELNSYNILQAMDAKLKYRHSCAMLYIFSGVAATTGGAYTNNNYALIHNGTTKVYASLAQRTGKHPPSDCVFASRACTIYDAPDATINADGSFTYRKPEAAVNAPIGALCMLVEYPWVNADGTFDLTLWGE